MMAGTNEVRRPEGATAGRPVPVMRLESIDLGSPLAYVVVGALALVDGVIPLVPARTALIGLGAVAGTGDYRAYPLLLVATVAAFVSDNVSYWIGGHYWPWISRVVFKGTRSQRMWGWVQTQLERHGTGLVALARVVPGGPTPITLTAGMIGMPKTRFRLAAACSAVLWSAYAFAVGAFGDAVTGGETLVALLVGLALAAAVNLGLRAAFRSRRQPPDSPHHRLGTSKRSGS